MFRFVPRQLRGRSVSRIAYNKVLFLLYRQNKRSQNPLSWIARTWHWDVRAMSPRWGLTMRLSDAGLRRRRTKVLYPNHRSPPWLTEDPTPRSLEPIVRRQHTARGRWPISLSITSNLNPRGRPAQISPKHNHAKLRVVPEKRRNALT
jgi:hypothetical protein